MNTQKKPAYLFTDDNGEVLMLRCIEKNGTSHGGTFQNPTEVGAIVEAPDWRADGKCGGGIHAWPLGLGIGDGKDPDYRDGLWQVVGVKPKDGICGELEGGGKCKFRRGTIRYCGGWQGAFELILDVQTKYIIHATSGAASATGWRGAASATGWSGAASATATRGAASATGESGAASATGESGAASATGESGAASATATRGAASATGESGAASATGWSGAASATGWSGAASATGTSGAASATGWSGAASATGWSGAASATGTSGAASATGDSSCACVTGLDGKAMAGEYGVIALQWWNTKSDRAEMRCARVVDGKRGTLKPNIWYRLNGNGQFVECE